VAIDGNTIVVGAYAKDSYTGSVYVFRSTEGPSPEVGGALGDTSLLGIGTSS
jgi:hypothetical protein